MNTKDHTPDGTVPAGVLADTHTRFVASLPSTQALIQAREDYETFRNLSAEQLERMGLTQAQADALTLADFVRRPHR